MDIKFSREFSTIVSYARDEAMRTGSYGIGADHLMLGILRHASNGACTVLSELGIDLAEFKDYIDSRIFQDVCIPYGDLDRIQLSKHAQRVLKVCTFEALRADAREVRAVHLLLAVSRVGESFCSDFLSELSAGYEPLRNCMDAKGLLSRQGNSTIESVPITKEIAGALGEQLANSLRSFRDMTSMPS